MKIILYLSFFALFTSCQKDGSIENTTTEKTTIERKQSPGLKAQAMVKSGALLVDVRTSGEFSSGSISGAINIPVQALKSRMAELDKTKDIVVFCASGARSSAAKKMLEEAGYKTVFNMGGKNAWKK